MHLFAMYYLSCGPANVGSQQKQQWLVLIALNKATEPAIPLIREQSGKSTGRLQKRM